MIKKFFAKLIGSREKETDFSARTYNEKSANESRREALEETFDAKARHQQIMAGRDIKYIDDTVPIGEVRRPDDSAAEKQGE